MARGAGQGSVGPQGLWGKGELGSWSERAHNLIAQETAISIQCRAATQWTRQPHSHRFCASTGDRKSNHQVAPIVCSQFALLSLDSATSQTIAGNISSSTMSSRNASAIHRLGLPSTTSRTPPAGVGHVRSSCTTSTTSWRSVVGEYRKSASIPSRGEGSPMPWPGELGRGVWSPGSLGERGSSGASHSALNASWAYRQ